MSARTVWQSLMLPPWRFLTSRWPWLGLLYTVLSALLTLVLIPVLVVTFIVLPLWGILIAALERRRLRLLGLSMPPSGHVHVPLDERRHWLNIRLMEPATWRETLSVLAGMVLGAIAVVVVFTQGMALAILIAIPMMATRRETNINLFGETRLVLGPDTWWQPLLLVPVALVLFAYVNATLAATHGACIRWFIAPRVAEIDLRVEELTRSRVAIVNAHEERTPTHRTRPPRWRAARTCRDRRTPGDAGTRTTDRGRPSEDGSSAGCAGTNRTGAEIAARDGARHTPRRSFRSRAHSCARRTLWTQRHPAPPRRSRVSTAHAGIRSCELLLRHRSSHQHRQAHRSTTPEGDAICK